MIKLDKPLSFIAVSVHLQQINILFFINVRCNISRIRCSVSSPDETLRREMKYDTQPSIFDKLRGVSSGDETLFWILTLYYFSNKMILEGEIKDAKMSGFSSDLQALIKH